MKENEEHSDLKTVDEQSKALLANGTFNWSKSKEEVWAELVQHTHTSAPKKNPGLPLLSKRFIAYGMAASIALLLGIGTFLNLYTLHIEAPAGTHQQAVLPDGSVIELNAGTNISYKPYVWPFNRKVNLYGEAFFQVEKGKRFRVISPNGTTEVLGTSFNIYDRASSYKVTCISGSVQVTSKEKVKVILKPGTHAELREKGSFDLKDKVNVNQVMAWRQNLLTFNATPINKVFDEIARQYNVHITAQVDSSLHYSGNFTKKQEIESILGYICPALGLEFTKMDNNSYRITAVDE